MVNHNKIILKTTAPFFPLQMESPLRTPNPQKGVRSIVDTAYRAMAKPV